MNKYINCGTLNVRGIKTDQERITLAKDATRYELHILSIPETHLTEDTLEDITVKDEKGETHSYVLYATTKTGLLVKKELQPKIKKIDERICSATMNLKDHKLHYISAYAHTLEKSNKNPEDRENFYEALEATIEKTPERDLLIIGGDFNAKTGSGHTDFPSNMGKFGKGLINSSGKRLLETCQVNNLIITNTLFQHKKAHRTTWEAPYRKFTTRTGEQRRNPVRNQIDYIITKISHRRFVTDARSYGGIRTDTDHKLVKARFHVEWYKIKNNTEKKVKIDISNFYSEEKKTEYRNEVLKEMEKIEEQTTVQDKWNTICKVCTDAGKKILGTVKNHVVKKDVKAEELSDELHKTNKDITATQDAEVRKTKEKHRRELKAKLRARLKQIEEAKLEKKLQEIENSKNDSNRYYKAIKEIRRLKKVEPLTVKNENGEVATTEEQQIEIVTSYFKRMLAPEGKEIPSYKPTKLRRPFTAEEIRKIAHRMKNGKSAGIDKLEAEFIKYAPIEILQEIANIYNTVTNTDEELRELVVGLLRPLQKPGKKKGPPENLRPIVLLSVLRKILTIAMLDRLWERLKKKLPLKQAAYQPGRGTTEQVHAVKLLVEKAIISSDYTIHLLLLDMSKAFDTVDRQKLFEHLQEILHNDELYILHILTNNPQIAVKIGNTTGETFTSTIGIMQGDCLSAILFIFYLAMCLRQPIHTKTKGFFINPTYADDLTLAGTNEQQINDTEHVMVDRLTDYNLMVNASKKEKYQIPRPPPPAPPPPTLQELHEHRDNRVNWSALDWLVTYKPPIPENPHPDWKKCKLLGSLLDTESDIRRRKGLTLTALLKFENIFKSKRINTQLKIRTFNAYIASIFLFNSEIWTLTETLQNEIDAFQRRLLRRAINIRWPKVISSEELYKKVGAEKWSTTIRKRRLNWLGHLMRLDERTPVRRSLEESLTDVRRKIGRPCLTWIKVVEKDLESVDINLDLNKSTPSETLRKLVNLTADRNKWRKKVRDIMAVNRLIC